MIWKSLKILTMDAGFFGIGPEFTREARQSWIVQAGVSHVDCQIREQEKWKALSLIAV
jgi:hypothetical protein